MRRMAPRVLSEDQYSIKRKRESRLWQLGR
jgi:hypothetical protein